jgi:transposase
VAEILNCSKRTVQRQLQRFKDSNSFLEKQKTGRQKSLTTDKQNQFLLWSKRTAEGQHQSDRAGNV